MEAQTKSALLASAPHAQYRISWWPLEFRLAFKSCPHPFPIFFFFFFSVDCMKLTLCQMSGLLKRYLSYKTEESPVYSVHYCRAQSVPRIVQKGKVTQDTHQRKCCTIYNVFVHTDVQHFFHCKTALLQLTIGFYL